MKVNKILTSFLISFMCAMQVQAMQQNKVIITFSDNQEMLVDQQIIDTLQVVSETIKSMYEDVEEDQKDQTLTLPGISKISFEQLLPYFEIITESVIKGAKKSEFNREVILAALNREIKDKQIENPLPTLFSLLNGANYLDIELLVEAFSHAISDILTTNKQVQDKFIKDGTIVGLESDPYLQDKIAKQIFEKNPEIHDYLAEQPIQGTKLFLDSPFDSLAFSPDGSKILTASEDKTAQIWDANNGALLFTLAGDNGHTEQIKSAAFSPDGSKVITGSEDKTAKIWDANNGALLFTLAGNNGHTGQIASAAFSPDGSKVVTASEDKTAKIWNTNNGTLLFTLTGNNGHTKPVTAAKFSPDGSKVVTASVDKTAKIWDANNGTLLFTLAGDNGHTKWIRSAAFSSDGSKVVTASSHDATAKIWDANNGALLFTLARDNERSAKIQSAAFSPDGSKVITGSWRTAAQIWDANNGAFLFTLAGDNGHTDSVDSAVFSPDGSKVVTASMDKTIKIWDANNGTLLFTFPGESWHANLVNSSAFSPDGTKIAAISGRNTINIWNFQNDLAIHDYFDNKLQTIEQALFLYLLNQSNDKQALLTNEKLQPIINSFPQEVSDVLRAMI